MKFSREDLIFLFHVLPTEIKEMPSRDLDPLVFQLGRGDNLQARLDDILSRISLELERPSGGKCEVCHTNTTYTLKKYDTGNGLTQLCNSCYDIATSDDRPTVRHRR